MDMFIIDLQIQCLGNLTKLPYMCLTNTRYARKTNNNFISAGLLFYFVLLNFISFLIFQLLLVLMYVTNYFA